jgi:hypothetical protein
MKTNKQLMGISNILLWVTVAWIIISVAGAIYVPKIMGPDYLPPLVLLSIPALSAIPFWTSVIIKGIAEKRQAAEEAAQAAEEVKNFWLFDALHALACLNGSTWAQPKELVVDLPGRSLLKYIPRPSVVPGFSYGQTVIIAGGCEVEITLDNVGAVPDCVLDEVKSSLARAELAKDAKKEEGLRILATLSEP